MTSEDGEWADIGYLRISDDRTGEAASIKRQRQQITDAAGREGRAITHWFEDESKSAWKPGVVRPGFGALLAACAEHPVTSVWVLHGDRLIRQGDEDDLPAVTRVLAPRRIIIRCVESADMKLWQAEGKMMARVLNAVNGYESDRKQERVRLAAEDRARRGGFPGGRRRFGYRHSGTRTRWKMADDGTRTAHEHPSGPLELVPGEAQAIADGYRMIASGSTLDAVVRDWRARGLKGPGGAAIGHVMVRDVLAHPHNAGLSSYKGEIVGKGDWPAVTDPDTFADVRAILDARRTGPGRPPATLLAGVLRCWKCSGPLNGSYRGVRADGSIRRSYACTEGHVSRSREPLDDAVSELAVKHVRDNARKLTRRRRAVSRTVARAVAEVAMLGAQVEAYQGRAAEFDPADLAAILRKLRARLAEAEAKMVQEAGRPASQALVSSGDVLAAWIGLDTAGRRAVIREQIEKITVGPGLPGPKQASMHNVRIRWRPED